MRNRKPFQTKGKTFVPVLRRAVKSACCTAAVIACILTGFLWYADGKGDAVPTGADAGTGEAVLPVLMYHSILKDPQKAGAYVVSPETFEADILELKRRGYESVVVQDLIDYVYHGEPLPEKPVMITLDDGYYNNLTYVLPILENTDMKAVISVVGSYTERYSETPDPNPNYAYLSFDDIRALSNSGRVEIQNHSYDMHSGGSRKGTMKLPEESEARYKKLFCEDAEKTQRLLTENCGVTPSAFAYPFGCISESSEEYLKEMGFLCSMSCYERLNMIGDEESLFNLGRFNRPSGIDSAAFLDGILPE